ncbi:hypothetical protein FT663_02791 [Candidozyma haemuli var. vulneris]|uniref:Uncharacterized protein n=1 Tax=Candidozyma haemuli TaxID=45357 RepID=A0A2V1AZ81_9ASCO|nr:hypothetical protein CXQ85_005237 [[Candida] haemuloni]KAF3991290.1 hypothetical protein FT663_02791 [[Candida] haemuloni var. vulneris]KAF3991976.1 hypothetical protein FT662_01429 [[Candida] haemuloni var. vulneris]PVH22663.1 hypothetical protein CXQ85_005237 [[Candida] haemuloni]
MKIFVSSSDVPIGYVTPKFPAIFWPLGITSPRYNESFLYYSVDIWKFTVYWVIIFFSGAYFLVGVAAFASMNLRAYRERKIVASKKKAVVVQSVIVAASYLLAGVAQGFMSGAIIGLLLAAIYRAGALAMSTWIPFSWGMASILYHICSSYSTSSLLM